MGKSLLFLTFLLLVLHSFESVHYIISSSPSSSSSSPSLLTFRGFVSADFICRDEHCSEPISKAFARRPSRGSPTSLSSGTNQDNTGDCNSPAITEIPILKFSAGDTVFVFAKDEQCGVWVGELRNVRGRFHKDLVVETEILSSTPPSYLKRSIPPKQDINQQEQQEQSNNNNNNSSPTTTVPAEPTPTDEATTPNVPADQAPSNEKNSYEAMSRELAKLQSILRNSRSTAKSNARVASLIDNLLTRANELIGSNFFTNTELRLKFIKDIQTPAQLLKDSVFSSIGSSSTAPTFDSLSSTSASSLETSSSDSTPTTTEVPAVASETTSESQIEESSSSQNTESHDHSVLEHIVESEYTQPHEHEHEHEHEQAVTNENNTNNNNNNDTVSKKPKSNKHVSLSTDVTTVGDRAHDKRVSAIVEQEEGPPATRRSFLSNITSKFSFSSSTKLPIYGSQRKSDLTASRLSALNRSKEGLEMEKAKTSSTSNLTDSVETTSSATTTTINARPPSITGDVANSTDSSPLRVENSSSNALERIAE